MGPAILIKIVELATVVEKLFDVHLRKEYDLTFAQYKVLRVIGIKHGSSQKQVAESLQQTEASISRQARLLLHKGLLINDRSVSLRTRTLLPTEQGESVLQDATDYLEQLQGQVVGSLAYQEQRLLQEMLGRMHQKSTGLTQ